MGAGKGETKRVQVSASVRPGLDEPTIYENGRKEWRNAAGNRHRVDGPAVEYADGSMSWYQNGDLHRLDGPTVERPDGYKEWRVDGQLHRVDGPAIEYANGARSWWANGNLHRDGGPATERANGNRSWYKNGERHRVDGPAVEGVDGYKAWWVDGVELTETEFEERAAALRLEAARTAALEAAEREIMTNPDYRYPFGRG